MENGLPKAEVIDTYRYPSRFDNSSHLKELTLECVRLGASDIYLQPGVPACARISGKLQALGNRILSASEIELLAKWATDRQSADTAYKGGTALNARYLITDPTLTTEFETVRRSFRVNVSPITYDGNITAQIVMRSIPLEPFTLKQAGLDEDIARKMCPRNGLVLIAGETGSGKSTTFGSVVRFICENDTPIKGNIITVEEPIEFTYERIKSIHSIVAQSQIPENFKDFAAANAEAMRRKPNLLVYGEMRDKESITAGIEASMTGHPVFATVHASDVAAVIKRLISRYPEEQRATAIYDIIDNLRFIMAQTLVPSVTGGLIPARSWLEFTLDIRESLSSMTNMAAVTSKVRTIVNTDGHSYSAEAHRLLEAGLIDKSGFNHLSHL